MKKFCVYYKTCFNTETYIHVFAEDEADARAIIMRDGVGYDNGKPVIPSVITNIYELPSRSQHNGAKV